jgi:hypothetical protein
MSNLIHLFPTTIYKERLDLDINSISEFIEKIKLEYNQKAEDHKHLAASNNSLCYANVLQDLHKWPEMAELVKLIRLHAYRFWKSSGYKERFIDISQMWFNVYKKGSFLTMHNHSPSYVAGTFYLSKTDSGSNIRFLDPNEMLLKTQPYGYSSSEEFEFFEKEIEVSTGDLLLFPGFLKHRTAPVNDDSERICIAFNFMRTY